MLVRFSLGGRGCAMKLRRGFEPSSVRRGAERSTRGACAPRMLRFSLGSALCLLGVCSLFVRENQGATLAGQHVEGGKMIEIRFPVAKYFQDIAAQSGNPR